MEYYLQSLYIADRSLRGVLDEVEVVGSDRAQYLYMVHRGCTGQLLDIFDERWGCWRVRYWRNTDREWTEPDKEIDVDSVEAAIYVINDLFFRQ